jgi:demethylmenaquinone methyltransferase/2-methoxy-6-polyprenyl-1,4-benzoquinol methylase
MCCGTGDLAFSFAAGPAKLKKITGCDLSPEMVELAKEKQKQLRSEKSLPEFEWAVADCTATDFENESFDIISCAFGVRNMENLPNGLTEMHRLLRPGGRACILEFSLPKGMLMRWVYLIYLNWILPLLGGIISGRFSAYRYLAKSVKQWSQTVDLQAELKNAGFNSVVTKKLSLAVVTAYIAYKG